MQLQRAFWPYVAVVLGLMMALQIISVRGEAQTVDEAVYLAAGVTYWTTGDYRMNPEHPPLEKLISALPLLPLHLDLRTGTKLWSNVIGPGLDEYYYAQDFLYNNRVPWQTILFLARLPTIVLTAVFGLILALWTLRRAGAWAGIIAVTLFAFDPTLLAHGRYVTNDLWIGFFVFVACIAWDAAVSRKTALPYFAIAGLALGCAFGTKASAIALPIIFLGIAIARRAAWKSVVPRTALTVVIALGVLALLYRGSLGAYATGFLFQYHQFQAPHLLAYLFGQKSESGWWYYYPAVFAIKTPLAELTLTLVAVVVLTRKKKVPGNLAVLIVPIVTFAIVSLFAHIDIGIRYLLPIYPMLFAFIGIVACSLRPHWPIAACLGFLAVESLTSFPNYLPFANIAFGGPDQTTRYVLDSNADWGQAAPQLKTWLDARGISKICFAYFGAEPRSALGFTYVDVPPNPTGDPRNVNCLVAASAQYLFLHDDLAWLRALQPVVKVGHAIYVYDLRHGTGAGGR